MRVAISIYRGGRSQTAFADTEAGALLEAEAPQDPGVALVARTAVYEPIDHATAPLFLVRGVATVAALDPAPRRRTRCALCGMTRQRDLPAGGYRVTAELFGSHDLVRSHQEWLVSARLGERLRDRRGGTLHPLRGASGYLLRCGASLGWPSDGTKWDDPCDTCGQRTGATPPTWIAGVNTFARDAWQGDDLVGIGPMPSALVVSRGVRRLLEEPGWRITGLNFEPVLLESV